jgi:hypothetical protein
MTSKSLKHKAKAYNKNPTFIQAYRLLDPSFLVETNGPVDCLGKTVKDVAPSMCKDLYDSFPLFNPHPILSQRQEIHPIIALPCSEEVLSL